ncbi:MAG: type II secretion system protein [Verrucomicrobia bacterium]|nr:type II secretion system protein [Verrucomicrobiota bacterium]
MKLSRTNPRFSVAERRHSAFTLVEVLAALLFMAIVIPAAVQGLRLANLAGQVAERKSVAARLAERVLNEAIVTKAWQQSGQSGSVQDSGLVYRWQIRNETWYQEPLRALAVQVTYAVQGRDYDVRLSTLVDTSQP